MRDTTAPAPNSSLRQYAIQAKRTIFAFAALAVVIWAGYGYAQEAYLWHKLGQQVTDLRHQNAVLATQNQGYHKDIEAMTSGAGNEEEARLNGYSKPNEHVYLVTGTPPPPPPSPAPSPHPSPAAPTP